jgi:acetyl-CoA carboxylase beta subunit
VDCDSLVVKCPTCSGGIYGDQLEDHDQWCPRSSIGMAAC